MLEVTTPPPPPPMERSQNMSADYWATGPFHFGLGKAAVLNDFPCSTFIVDQTLSIWCNEAYSCFIFLAQLNQIVSSSTSIKETIETAEKTITTTSYI